MKSIVCQKPGELFLKEQPRPSLSAGNALVRMKRLGICGTDLHAYGGRQPFFSYPRILGHELSAEIVEIDGGQTGLQVGETVAVIPYLECGGCIACRNGKPNCCVNMQVLGVHRDGGMSEYLSIPADHLIKNNRLSPDQLALTECFSIGAHAVRRAAVQPGEQVLVIGAGPIGLGIMQFARIAGGSVIALDISKERLDFVEKHIPVQHTIQAGTVAVAQRLAEITNNDFPTVIFDATGNRQSMMDGFLYLAHGGRYVLVSLVTADISFPDPELHKRETTLLSSRNALRADFEWVMECMADNKVKTAPMITHRCSFVDLAEQFPLWTRPESSVIKGIVEF